MLLAACVADNAGTSLTTSSIQPRQASYDCGGGVSITVENAQNAVRLVDAEGTSYDLPAAPPGQMSRYGEGGFALVLEQRDALWMKAGDEPMTCRR